MKEYYYGGWKSLYLLDWPIRFLIELMIFLVLLFGVIRLIKQIEKMFQLKVKFVIVCAWFASEVVYLIGKSSTWAVDIDDNIMKWGREAAYEKKHKKHFTVKAIVMVVSIMVYFMAIFSELPVAENLQGYYLTPFFQTKNFFQEIESSLSKGYEAYAPLFEWKEIEKEEVIYLSLNERGFAGSNVRYEPSLESSIVREINGEVEIVYQGEWINDGERKWIKVYIPEAAIEGWISGALIESTQLDAILFEEK